MAISDPELNSRVQFSKKRGFGVASGILIRPVGLGVGLPAAAGLGEVAEGRWGEDADSVGGRDIEPTSGGGGVGPPPPHATTANPSKGASTARTEARVLSRIIIP